MTRKPALTLQKFHTYQKERFPLVVLALSFLPAVLSSGAVISGHPMFWQIAGALGASLAYLFHVRVVDEHRDFEHDHKHHASRPLQRGVITKEELNQVDLFAILILVIIAAMFGTLTFLIALGMLAYAYVAEKEFFLGEAIRRRFFLYNGVNLLQMLLLQLLVYAVFGNPFPVSALVAAHFLFTAVGTLVFEFLRKVKPPEGDGTGKDTYTAHLGFSVALGIYVGLLLADTLLFFRVVTFAAPNAIGTAFFITGLAALALLPVLVHTVQKTHRSEQLMQASFLMLYGIFNLTIYFLALHT